MKNQQKRIDITGQRFGRLTAIRDVGSIRKRRLWKFQCDCGRKTIVDGVAARNGNTKSCGCLRLEAAVASGKLNTKHGLDGTAVYISWIGMLHRCYDANEVAYPNYGGRGIRVCEYIRSTPLNLKALLGDRPKGLSLNRIKNNFHYSCGACSECMQKHWELNVEWATRIVQNRNTRQNVNIEIGGITRCASEWEEVSGIPMGTILWRLRKGWDADRLLSVGQCKV